MTDEPVRFGLVGAGAIAQAYAQAFRQVDTGFVCAVADARPEVAQALAEQLHCTAYPSHEDLAASGNVDAVVVCTPPATHVEICEHALEQGLAVLCEKPLALSTADARKLIEVAQRHDRVLTMAAKFRYVEDVIRAKSIIASGLLGDPILFENTFASRVDMRRRWNSQPEMSGGGVLIDNGTHSVDLARYLVGPVTEVMAVEGKRAHSLQVEDTARMLIRTPGGMIGTIDLSWIVDKELDSYVDILGSEGTIRVGWKQARYRQTSSPEWVVFGAGYDKIAALAGQLDNFANAVLGREHLLIGPEDALASVAVIEAAYTSIRLDRWVEVSSCDSHGDRQAAAPISG